MLPFSGSCTMLPHRYICVTIIRRLRIPPVELQGTVEAEGLVCRQMAPKNAGHRHGIVSWRMPRECLHVQLQLTKNANRQFLDWPSASPDRTRRNCLPRFTQWAMNWSSTLLTERALALNESFPWHHPEIAVSVSYSDLSKVEWHYNHRLAFSSRMHWYPEVKCVPSETGLPMNNDLKPAPWTYTCTSPGFHKKQLKTHMLQIKFPNVSFFLRSRLRTSLGCRKKQSLILKSTCSGWSFRMCHSLDQVWGHLWRIAHRN